MQLRVTTEWSENSQNPRQYFLQMILSKKLFLWVLRRSQRSGLCLFGTGDLRTHSSQFSSRTGLQPDGCWGRCPQTPEVYPLLEYPVKKEKSSYISATAPHRFIPQPASGRSSALPCLAANIVLSKLLWEIHLHGLKFIPQPRIFVLGCAYYFQLFRNQRWTHFSFEVKNHLFLSFCL